MVQARYGAGGLIAHTGLFIVGAGIVADPGAQGGYWVTGLLFAAIGYYKIARAVLRDWKGRYEEET